MREKEYNLIPIDIFSPEIEVNGVHKSLLLALPTSRIFAALSQVIEL